MRIFAYAICYNEERMLPFFMRHYGSFCEKITVYDNMSTDRSREIVLAHPAGEVVTYDTCGRLRNDVYLDIKNHAWKKDRAAADFVVMCDVDELLWHPDVLGYLERCKAGGVTLPRTNGYSMGHSFFPDAAEDPRQLSEIATRGSFTPGYCKRIVFDPKGVSEINYSTGAHYCDPEGDIAPSNSNAQPDPPLGAPVLPGLRETFIPREDPTAELKVLHYRCFGYDEFIKHARRLMDRCGPMNSFELQSRISPAEYLEHWEGSTREVVKINERRITKMSEKKVAIIIPVFNQLELTRDCVDSIARCTPEPHDLILVDNGSDSQTSVYLRSVPGAAVIRLPKNAGFAGGVNAGLEAALGSDVVILNNDTIVTRGWLSELRKAAHVSSDIGLSVACSNSISQSTDQYMRNAPESPDGDLNAFAEMLLRGRSGRVINTPYVAAFCVYVRAAALLDVPALSTEFGLGNGEDQDFVLTLLSRGWRSVVATGCFVFHRGSQTLNAIGFGEEQGKIKTYPRIAAILNKKWAAVGVGPQANALAFTRAGTPEYLKLWKSVSETGPMMEGKRRSFERLPNKRVSIVIPFYNQSEYLEECLRSATSQTYRDCEVIVVNDGSSPEESRAAKSIVDTFPSVLYAAQPNSGLPAARNTGIRAARGSMILPLDADDKISEDCVEQSVKLMSEGAADIIYGRCQCFGECSGLWNFEYDVDALLKDSLFQCTALFMRSHWEECGGYNEQLIRGREDWDFWLRMASQGHFGRRIGSVLFYYRKKKQSMLTDLRPAYAEVTEIVMRSFPLLFSDARLSRSEAAREIMSRRNLPLPQRRAAIRSLRNGEEYSSVELSSQITIEERLRRRRIRK
jgi:GT2 family glycosyltransferase